jgi:hypothetical protein
MASSKAGSSKIQLTMKTSLFQQLRQTTRRKIHAARDVWSKSDFTANRFDSNLGSASEMELYPGSLCDVPCSFLLGLHNMASIYREFNSGFLQSSFKKLDPFPLGLNSVATF